MKNTLLIIFILAWPISIFGQTPGYLDSVSDDFSKLTVNYVPDKWEFFDFYTNPFSPVYRTEVAVPESAYIEILIYQKSKNDSLIIINDRLARRNVKYSPGIYEVNWTRTTDNLILPVPAGKYEFRFSAYSDSLKMNLLLQNETSLYVLNYWQEFDHDFVSSFMTIKPAYNLKEMIPEISKSENQGAGGVQFGLRGARIYKPSDSLRTDNKIALSFRFDENAKAKRNIKIYTAKQEGEKLTDLSLNSRLGALIRGDYYSVSVDQNLADYLVISHKESDLALIDLRPVWFR